MGGVIFKNGTREAIKILISQYGIEESIANDIYNGSQSWDLRARLISSDKYWSFINEKYSNDALLKKVNLKNLWYEQFTPMEGMLELLYSLKGKVKVGVISGNIEDRVEYLFKKYNLHGFFDFEAYSFTFNLHKNDPALYRCVVEKFYIKPNEAIFIDDNLDCLEAAKQNGFYTHLFIDSEQLRGELKNYGIK